MDVVLGVLVTLVAFVAMLLILVVVHELGHFFTARAFGVKVLEFGFGYPPRAFGFYSGRTPVLIDQGTQFVNLNGIDDLGPGQFIRVSSTEDGNGNLVARIIERPVAEQGRKGPQSLQELANDEYLKHEGKVRQVDGSSLILADMLYSVNWLPLGGFVRLAGESNPAVPRSLASKGTGPRAVVLAAGSFMNAVLPIILFTILFMIPQDVAVGDVVVTQVVPGSPANAAGVQAGDIILQAGGEEIESPTDLVRAISLNAGSEMQWLVERGGTQEVIRVTPRLNPPPDEGATGIGIDLINSQIVTRSDPPWTALGRAFSNTWEMLVLLKQEVSSWFSGGRTPELSGPIGIAQVTGEVTQEGGLHGWLVLVILFSINLAILNILPIPMLDGGRLLFVGIEWARRGKRIPPEKEGLVHLIGFVVLIGIIILISANDINRLLQGGSPLGN
jgi:regulator of sigma E protease